MPNSENTNILLSGTIKPLSSLSISASQCTLHVVHMTFPHRLKFPTYTRFAINRPRRTFLFLDRCAGEVNLAVQDPLWIR